MKQKDDHPWQQINGARSKRGHPEGMGAPEIPVEKVLAAFRQSGLSKSELARRMGWLKVVPNINRVSQTLGQAPDGAGRIRQRLTYPFALRLAKAMNASLVDMGI